MDQTKHHQNKRSLSQLFMNAQFLKRVITKLLLSLSVFSLLFSHSNWLYDLLLNFNFFSSLPIKLISHTLDKNYTFLLCNGLLVFLAKYSGLFNSSSSSSKHVNSTYNEYYTYKSFQDYSNPEMVVMEQDHDQVPLLKKEEEDGSDHQSSSSQNDHKHSEEVVTIDVEDKYMVEEDHKLQGKEEEEEEDDDEEKQAFVEEKQEEEEEEEEEYFNEEHEGGMFWEEIEEKEEEERGGNGKLSTEELNKKFDEFIKKMKEELRIEAQRQLVMV